MRGVGGHAVGGRLNARREQGSTWAGPPRRKEQDRWHVPAEVPLCVPIPPPDVSGCYRARRVRRLHTLGAVMAFRPYQIARKMAAEPKAPTAIAAHVLKPAIAMP